MHGTLMAKVTWIDAETTGDTAWQSLEEIKVEAVKPPPIMTTIGWVLHDCPTHLSLVDTLGPEDCSMMHKIPKEMIRQISTLIEEQETFHNNVTPI